jgi:hypothetical protein
MEIEEALLSVRATTYVHVSLRSFTLLTECSSVSMHEEGQKSSSLRHIGLASYNQFQPESSIETFCNREFLIGVCRRRRRRSVRDSVVPRSVSQCRPPAAESRHQLSRRRRRRRRRVDWSLPPEEGRQQAQEGQEGKEAQEGQEAPQAPPLRCCRRRRPARCPSPVSTR